MNEKKPNTINATQFFAWASQPLFANKDLSVKATEVFFLTFTRLVYNRRRGKEVEADPTLLGT